MTIVPTVLSSALRIALSDGLDDVDLGAARVDEGDAVEGRHINALGEAAGVREHAALVRV